jgi:hypothetical protein
MPKGSRKNSTVVSTEYPAAGPMPFMNSSRFNATNQTFTCQSQVSATFTTTSTVAVTLPTKVFSLADLPNASTLTAVFDQYRIKLVEIWLTPAATQSTPGAPEIGYWTSVVDLDDGAAAGNYNAVAVKPGAIQSPILVGHYHGFRPKFAQAVYSGAFTSFAQGGDGWVDCSSPTVQFYGVKAATGVSTTAILITAVVRYTVEFRGISA